MFDNLHNRVLSFWHIFKVYSIYIKSRSLLMSCTTSIFLYLCPSFCLSIIFVWMSLFYKLGHFIRKMSSIMKKGLLLAPRFQPKLKICKNVRSFFYLFCFILLQGNNFIAFQGWIDILCRYRPRRGKYIHLRYRWNTGT